MVIIVVIITIKVVFLCFVFVCGSLVGVFDRLNLVGYLCSFIREVGDRSSWGLEVGRLSNYWCFLEFWVYF